MDHLSLDQGLSEICPLEVNVKRLRGLWFSYTQRSLWKGSLEREVIDERDHCEKRTLGREVIVERGHCGKRSLWKEVIWKSGHCGKRPL